MFILKQFILFESGSIFVFCFVEINKCAQQSNEPYLVVTIRMSSLLAFTLLVVQMSHPFQIGLAKLLRIQLKACVPPTWNKHKMMAFLVLGPGDPSHLSLASTLSAKLPGKAPAGQHSASEGAANVSQVWESKQGLSS